MMMKATTMENAKRDSGLKMKGLILSRRRFIRNCCAAGGLAGVSLLSIGARLRGGMASFGDDESFFEIRKLKPGLIAIYNGGGNAVVFTDAKSGKSVLSDCKLAHLGYTLRREIDAAGYRLEKVINTHHHLDHTGGNYAFNGDLELIAHKNLTPRVREQVAAAKQRALAGVGSLTGSAAAAGDGKRVKDRMATIGGDDFAPDTEMSSSELEVKVGEEGVVELRYVTNGHTDNDVFLRYPTLNAIHAGDLLFHELHPFIDVKAGASTRGWQKCVREIMKHCDADTVIVPGHGEITDVTGLKKQDEYFDQLRGVVMKARKAGKSRGEITQMKPGVFDGRGFEQLLSRNLDVMFDELENEEGG